MDACHQTFKQSLNELLNFACVEPNYKCTRNAHLNISDCSGAITKLISDSHSDSKTNSPSSPKASVLDSRNVRHDPSGPWVWFRFQYTRSLESGLDPSSSSGIPRFLILDYLLLDLDQPRSGLAPVLLSKSFASVTTGRYVASRWRSSRQPALA